MSEQVTISTVAKESKTPAIIGAGVLLGFMAQKAVNKAIGYAGTSGLLGDETATNLKKYISPALVTAGGVAINLSSKDSLVKNLGAGMAISGPVNIGMQLLWNKNPLAGLDGFLGALLDDPEDLDGYDDDPDLGDPDDDDAPLGEIGDGDPDIDIAGTPIAALPQPSDPSNIRLNVDQSEIKQTEGFGDILPTPTPGVRDVFPEPIFNGLAEEINLL